MLTVWYGFCLTFLSRHFTILWPSDFTGLLFYNLYLWILSFRNISKPTDEESSVKSTETSSPTSDDSISELFRKNRKEIYEKTCEIFEKYFNDFNRNSLKECDLNNNGNIFNINTYVSNRIFKSNTKQMYTNI